MCGRFTIRAPASELVRQFELLPVDEIVPRYNVAPSQRVPVVRPTDDGHRQLAWLRWGLVPHWADDKAIGNRMINARAETVASKPAFRSAFRHRRCLVVADGFYEWEGTGRGKQPIFIHQPDDAPFGFAGLWESWTKGLEPIETCTIITTEANDRLRPLHDRMPVILPPEAYAKWLDPEADAEALGALLRPCANDLLETRPVNRYVNSPAHEGEDCLAPPDATLF